MKICELKPGMNCELVGEVVEASETRTIITKYGKKLKVRDIQIKDDSGSVAVTLWEDETTIPDSGANRQLEIKNGYVREYLGKISVSSGRGGTISLL